MSVEEEDLDPEYEKDIFTQVLDLIKGDDKTKKVDMIETFYMIPERLDPSKKGKISQTQENQYKEKKEEKPKAKSTMEDKKTEKKRSGVNNGYSESDKTKKVPENTPTVDINEKK